MFQSEQVRIILRHLHCVNEYNLMKQTTDWMLTSIRERLEQTFFQNEQIKNRLPVVQRNVETGRLPVSIAVENLLADFFNNQYKE